VRRSLVRRRSSLVRRRSSLVRRLAGNAGAGALAGAAATCALDATTYLDMALRGRPASSTPQQTVAAMAGARGWTIPGDEQTRQNRLDGLGALTGLATGVGVGAAYGLVDALLARIGHRPGRVTGAVLSGVGVMTMTNASMARYGVTDPSSWSAQDWLADLVPHAVYGTVLATGYAAARPRGHRGR
jgi:hypothetical protein